MIKNDKQETMFPLVSIAVLSYRNFDGIYCTLDSIFAQTYPNIELILCDDGSTNYCDYADSIERYILENKTDNIRNVIQHHIEQNVGTSKNCNMAIKLANGKYFKLVPVDDELYDANVIQKCVDYCENHQARILVGQTYVLRRQGRKQDAVQNTMAYRWKARSGRLCNYAPPTRDIRYLKNLNQKKRRKIIASRCIISTVSVFFSMELLRETNGFLEDYRLIEDMTYWPYIAKRGERIFFEEIIMMKYSLNGVSNGGPLNSEFFHDYMEIMEKIYIANEFRGGIFRKFIQRERLRQLEWLKISKESSNALDKICYADVILCNIIKDLKYLLIGSKL